MLQETSLLTAVNVQFEQPVVTMLHVCCRPSVKKTFRGSLPNVLRPLQTSALECSPPVPLVFYDNELQLLLTYLSYQAPRLKQICKPNLRHAINDLNLFNIFVIGAGIAEYVDAPLRQSRSWVAGGDKCLLLSCDFVEMIWPLSDSQVSPDIRLRYKRFCLRFEA